MENNPDADAIMKLFKNQFIQFMDELIAQFPDKTDLLVGRIFIDSQVAPSKLISYAISDVLPHSNKIKNQDEKYFLNSSNIFSSLPGNTVLDFKQVWNSSRLDDEDRDIIWAWFNSLVNICEKYQQSALDS